MAGDQHFGGMTIGWRLLWRQLRANPSIVVTIFVAILFAVVFLAATPRLFEQISNDALRDAIASPPPQQRNIALSGAGRISATTLDVPFARVANTGQRCANEEFPASVRSIMAEETFIADSTQFGIFPMPGEGDPSTSRAESRGSKSVCSLCSDLLPDEGPFPSFFRFRYQENIEDHVTLVKGALPRPSDPLPMLIGSECPDDSSERDVFEESIEIDCALQEVPVYEVAMTAETLSVLSFDLGDSVILKPDVDDPLIGAVDHGDLDYQIVLTVAGVIELTDVDDEYWYGDPRLHRASITENADVRILFVTGLINPDDYRALLQDLRPANWRYTWRFFVDPDLVDASEVHVLAADLRNLELGFRSVGSQNSGFSLVTLLSTLIDDYIAKRAVAVSLMSMALAGVFAIAVAVVLELAGLMTVSQRNR